MGGPSRGDSPSFGIHLSGRRLELPVCFSELADGQSTVSDQLARLEGQIQGIHMAITGDNVVSRVREETYLQDRIAAPLLAIFSGLIFFGMTAEWPVVTHDGVTHLRWIEMLTDALRTGVIYPRWFPTVC